MKENLKGWGWGVLAFLTCPCHLFFILPLLAGTALRSYLMAYKTVTILFLGASFALSLHMVFKKIGQEKTEDQTMDCCLPNKKEVK
jgi:mercuric ion transport protein